MRILSIGGGPAGLYFGILMRQAFPTVEIEIRERNRRGDTFGFGVVFSDETLAFLDDADSGSARAIRARFRSWSAIETRYRGHRTVSTGHGFSAIGRAELLTILSDRAVAVGCRVVESSEVVDVEGERVRFDLVVGADGVQSQVRELYAASFRPRIEWGKARFAWLGTDLALSGFTFAFAETEHGLFQAHAYPYAEDRSTWIVECSEGAWRAAGLDGASEAETVAICERLFARELGGARLYANRSIWRQFPTVSCASWRHENLVLVGDAVHTAHFSIGSGTKLAMEDAIELVARFRELGTADVPGVLEAYEQGRRLDVAKLQRAAATSRRWFENAERYRAQDPTLFTFNLMSRSHRITYDELRKRDPALVAEVDRVYAASRRIELTSEVANAEGAATDEVVPPPPVFAPFVARSIRLVNRIVVSPMCQYSAIDGVVDDWHLVHLGSRALGGAGLVVAEMTDVSPEGRITRGCAGLWNSTQVAAWRRIVDFVHAHSAAKIAIQLAHAGRKGSVDHPWVGPDRPLGAQEGAWETLGPSAEPYAPGWPVPRAMDRGDMDRVREQFVASTRLAVEAGFDWLEIHLAHGYLLSSFLSPLSNRREDDYGGPLERRMRYPLEVVRAVRAAWPAHLPLSVRISASDWLPDGFTDTDAVALARELAALEVDLVDVSSAGNVIDSPVEFGRMYQVPFADRIRHEVGVRVMAVGGLLDVDHANTVLAAERADLAVLARAHLANPYLTLHAGARYGVDLAWPGQYELGKRVARG